MLGDNPVDTIAAKGAGAISIALSYGFSSVEMLEKEQPDFLFHNFEEFVRTIQSS
jgi:phosphoglycolate phosphatase-like HAD superfamily hydrolase